MPAGASGLVAWLPEPATRWIGRRLGDLAWVALPRRRRIALGNLAHVFPTMPSADRRRLARASFQHLGLLTAEVSRALAEPPERTLERLEVEGVEHLREVMTAHGRALLVTAHLGNWEFLTYAHHATGFPLSIVVRTLDAPWVDGQVRRFRAAAGVEIIDKRAAVRPVLEALRRGRMVAILLDQNALRRESVFVPFFGRLASTSRGAATIALRTGTPIVPIFARREPDQRHRVTIEPPLIPLPGRPTDEAVVELTAACVRTIEEAIRRTPEQWLWMHDRWRTRPLNGDGTDGGAAKAAGRS